ncbi:MAG: hypothetical protein LQ337_002950 [Flavoplaca oasis]|nr:MAG: hypothetical protein LQ337_002950 [Flavoplaca oasis]
MASLARNKADSENKSKESGSPVIMNSDGSYTSVAPLTPETPYSTSPEDKPVPFSVTHSSDQALAMIGVSSPSLDPAARPPAIPPVHTSSLKIPSKSSFDFASAVPTNPFSSQPPATNGPGFRSRPTFGVTSGQNPIPSSPQQPSTNIFKHVPTSAKEFNPVIKAEAPQLLFPVPTQPVNDPSVEGPSWTNVLEIINNQGSGETSLDQIQHTNLQVKKFDLGMQMRHCHNNLGELNKCIVTMENKEFLKDVELRKLEDECIKLSRKSREASNASMAKLKEANSTIEAKNLCIIQLETDNENTKAEAQSALDRLASQIATKDEEIAKLKATNTNLENTNKGVTDQLEKDLEAKDHSIIQLEHDVENIKARAQSVYDQQAKQLTAKDEEIAGLKAINTDLESTKTQLKHNNESLKAESQKVFEQQAEQQAKQLTAKDEEIAKLKATNVDFENSEDSLTEKTNKDLEVKDRWITKLRRDLQVAEDKYKASVELHNQDKLKSKREHEESEIRIEDYRNTADAKSSQFDDLKLQVKEANLRAKMSEDHARSSDDIVEEQANAIERYKETVGELQATIQRLKTEHQDLEEEIKSMKLEKESGAESHHDCNAQIRRLEFEKEQEIEKVQRHYTLTHAEQAKHVEKELLRVQEAQSGLFQDLDKVQLRVQEDELTINKLEQENRRLQIEVEDNEKEARTRLSHVKTQWAEADTDGHQLLSSHIRGNELSQFSPAYSPQTSRASSQEPWRPQTESMIGDTADSDEGRHPTTLSYRAPRTLIHFEPSAGRSEQPGNNGLGVANVLCENYDQGTQTSRPPSSPKWGLSKIATVIEYKPRSSELGVSEPVVIMHTTPSSPPNLGLSRVSTVMNSKPSGPELSSSKPISTIDETQSSLPQLSISKLKTSINLSPSSTTQLGPSEPMSVVESKPKSPKLSISKLATIVDNPPSSPAGLDFSRLETVIELPPSAVELKVNDIVEKTQPTVPKLNISNIVTDQKLMEKSPPRWRWLWHLLMLLTMAILTLAAFYGESARRERNMWLEANDFTRRAVYSVRAGGGTGMGVPAWLWNDQLLDLTTYYYR